MIVTFNLILLKHFASGLGPIDIGFLLGIGLENSNNLSFLLDCKLFVSAIKVPTIYLVLLDVCGMKE